MFNPGDLVEPANLTKWVDEDTHPYVVIEKFRTDRGKELGMPAWRLFDPVKVQVLIQYEHELKKVSG